MAKIKHCSAIFIDLSKVDEIPSEFIEPYLAHYLMLEVEAIAFGFTKPSEARANLKGVERFITRFGGIHARIAVSNKYNDLYRLSDKDMIELCKEICKED